MVLAHHGRRRRLPRLSIHPSTDLPIFTSRSSPCLAYSACSAVSDPSCPLLLAFHACCWLLPDDAHPWSPETRRGKAARCEGFGQNAGRHQVSHGDTHAETGPGELWLCRTWHQSGVGRFKTLCTPYNVEAATRSFSSNERIS